MPSFGTVCTSTVFSPLVFLGGFWIALAGMLLWGIGYATQDTLLKALIASVLQGGYRSLAFEVFIYRLRRRLARRKRHNRLAL